MQLIKKIDFFGIGALPVEHRCGINNLKLNNMKSNLYIIIILVSFYSCTSWEDDMINKRTPYTGKEFRIDGCYYKQNLNGSYSFRFFYSNGVLLSFYDSCDITTKKQLKLNSNKYWSIFKVKGNTITETYWEEANMFQISLYDRYYEIVNDTTLLFTYKTYNNYFRFKKFSPKPDSTNIFIKQLNLGNLSDLALQI